MLRVSSPLFRFAGPTAVYNRKALGLGRGTVWRGRWGAVGRWHSMIGMSEPITPSKSIVQADLEMMVEVHRNRERHDQLRGTFHHIKATHRRAIEERRRWAVKRKNYLELQFKSYIQFQTMKTLKEQQQLVSQYGQMAVNRAVGDYKDEEERKQRLALVRRVVKAPVVLKQPRPHVVTRRQLIPARFDRKWTQAS